MSTDKKGVPTWLKVAGELAASAGLSFGGGRDKKTTTITTITPPNPDHERAIGLLQQKDIPFRTAHGLTKDSDQYASHWVENLRDANIIYGTYAALYRLSTGQPNPTAAAALGYQLQEINPAPDKENNLGLAYADHVQDIIKRVVTAEVNGADLKELITAQDIQIFQVAAQRFEGDMVQAVYDEQYAAHEYVTQPQTMFEKAAALDKGEGGLRAKIASRFAGPAAKSQAQRVDEVKAWDRANEALLGAIDKASEFTRPFAKELAKSLNPKFNFRPTAFEYDPSVLSHAATVSAFKLPLGDALRKFGAIDADKNDFLGDVQALSSVISTLHGRGGRKAKAIEEKLGTRGDALNIDTIGFEFKQKGDSDAARDAVLQEIKAFALANGAKSRDLDPNNEKSLFAVARQAVDSRVGVTEMGAANITVLIKAYAMKDGIDKQAVTDAQLTMQRVAHATERLNELLTYDFGHMDTADFNAVLRNAQNVSKTMTDRSRPGDTDKANGYFADTKETQIAETALIELSNLLRTINTPTPRPLKENEAETLFQHVENLLDAANEAADKFEANGYDELAEQANNVQHQILEILQPYDEEVAQRLEANVPAP